MHVSRGEGTDEKREPGTLEPPFRSRGRYGLLAGPVNLCERVVLHEKLLTELRDEKRDIELAEVHVTLALWMV